MREQLPWTDKSLGLHPSSDAGVMTLIGHNNDTSVPLPSDQESVRTHPFPLCQSGGQRRPPYNRRNSSTPFRANIISCVSRTTGTASFS